MQKLMREREIKVETILDSADSCADSWGEKS